MQKHMTIINLACTITKLRKWGEAWKHSAESAQANTARLHQANKELEREKFMTAGLIDKLIADRDEAWKERDTQTADHEAKMIEHRAAFGARTVADAKIIAGLRQEVQALREALAKEQELHAKTALRMATDAAKLAERKHPVKVGEYVKRLTGFNTTLAGEIGKVTRVDDDAAEIEYEVKRPNGETGVWCAKNCEPCDPPNHDTEAGKAAAERAAKTEPVEIKVGDLVEVVSNRGSNTWFADVGSFGTVTSVEEINDSILVNLDNVPGKKNALVGCVSFCDVRKVTT